MAKQTFTTGQVLTAAQMTDLQQTAMTGGAASTKTVSYVLVAADAGTRVAMNAAGSTTITVNTGLFSAGDTVSIQNIGAGVCTVTAGTATVNTSGSLVLAQYQGGILYFTSASAAIFFQYATPESGDITGVTAGTGISGGGTSGTVTITNSMATAIDAKADLIAGTGADTFARLAVGANDTVLTAASGETTGLKWAKPALTLISSTTFSNQATQAFDSVFSSSYKSYTIYFEEIYSSIANATIRFQWRYAGPTTQTASYYGGYTGGSVTGSNFAGGGISNGSYLQISTAVGTSDSQCMRGALTVLGCSGVSKNPTAHYQTTTMYDGTTANGGGWINAANTYTGFILSASTGNLTGTVSIYGVA